MGESPSLFSLCLQTISSSIIYGGDDNVQALFEMPSYFLESLIQILPPISLQKIHQHSVTTCGRGGYADTDISYGRKRGRYDDFNMAWKRLFKKRWPETLKKMKLMENNSELLQKPAHDFSDWQQLYWQAHLQNCLDEAAERSFLPEPVKKITGAVLSGNIMKLLGYGRTSKELYTECSNLSYHWNKFGHYARHLRLQNVHCVPEICELLRTSKLQELVFRRIISQRHVDGVCFLLNQNKESLLSLEFTQCQLSPTNVNQIFSALHKEGTHVHGIHHLCIESSFIFESNSSLMPAGLASFFSSGRSLKSVHLRDTHMKPKVAKMIFNTLLFSSSDLGCLEISDNNIGGWLSKVDRHKYLSSSMKPDASLKSLSVLNLRGNNLCNEDAEDLHSALVRIPNIRSLDISDNPFGDDGIRSLIPYFVTARGKDCPISDIKIEHCNLSSIGVSEFLRSLPIVEEPLNSLSIADNVLGSSVAEELSKFLSTSGLGILNIEDIELGKLGFEELGNGLSKDIGLVEINMSKNRGGIGAADFISKLIMHAPNLASVDAGYNIMTLESLPVISNALKELKGRPFHLDLTGNSSLSSSNSLLSEFQHHGKSIVSLPSFSSASAAYDDDP